MRELHTRSPDYKNKIKINRLFFISQSLILRFLIHKQKENFIIFFSLLKFNKSIPIINYHVKYCCTTNILEQN